MKENVVLVCMLFFVIVLLAFLIVSLNQSGLLNIPPLSNESCIKKFVDDWKENKYWGLWQTKHKIIQAENIVWHFSSETIKTIPHENIRELMVYVDEDTPFGACLDESAYGYALVERLFPESDVKIVLGTLGVNEDKSYSSHVWLMVDGRHYYINNHADVIPYIYFWVNYTKGSVEYEANETNINKYACG